MKIILDENEFYWPNKKAKNEGKINFDFSSEWNQNNEKNFKRLANSYYLCGQHILKKVKDEDEDFQFKEEVVLVGLYLLRHTMELYLKSMVAPQMNHDLTSLFNLVNKDSLNNLEISFLENYFIASSQIDEQSDFFRYPFHLDELELAEIKKEDGEFYGKPFVLNLEKTIAYIETAAKLIRKVAGEEDAAFNIENDNPKYLVSIVDDNNGYQIRFKHGKAFGYDFHPYFRAYNKAFFYIVNDEISLEEKALPMLFVLRQALELVLKTIIYNQYSKDKSLKKELENHNLKKLFEKANEIVLDLNGNRKDEEKIFDNFVKNQIKRLVPFYKDENIFRYPSNKNNKPYILNNYLNNITDNIFNSLKIISFYDSCSDMQEQQS